MCVGQPHSLCQREFRRMSPVNPRSVCSSCCGIVARRSLVAIAAFAALAFAPAASRADFLGDTGLNQRTSSGVAVADQVTLVGDDASLVELFISGRTGAGSSSGDQDTVPSRTPRHDDELPPTPKALAGNSTGGCGSIPGSASGGAFASPAGIVNEMAAPVAETCSGRIA